MMLIPIGLQIRASYRGGGVGNNTLILTKVVDTVLMNALTVQNPYHKCDWETRVSE